MKFLKPFFAALFIIFLASLTCFLSSADFNSESVTEELTNKYYYMLNLDTNTEVFFSNEDEKLPPAAMNKVLAAVYAFENWGDLSEMISISDDDLAICPTDYGIRKVGFSAGDSYTKLQIIQSMLIYSANDSEAVIAKRMAGSNEEFAKLLNEFASKIGCKNTNVVSVYGFDADGQYTTVKDVGKIFARGMKNADFSSSIQLSELKLPASANTGEKTFSTSVMMTYSSNANYLSSVKGGKETYTSTSGRCSAVLSVQDGYSYITVIMKGEGSTSNSSTNTANADAKKLISWVYANISIKSIADAGSVLSTMPVQGGKKSDVVQLTVEKTVSALVSNNASSSSVLVDIAKEDQNKKLVAPINEGDVICKASIKYAGETVAKVNLIAANTVSLSPSRLFMQKLSRILSSNIVIALEVIAILVLLAMLAFYILRLSGKASVDAHEGSASAAVKAMNLFNKVSSIFKTGGEKIAAGAGNAGRRIKKINIKGKGKSKSAENVEQNND